MIQHPHLRRGSVGTRPIGSDHAILETLTRPPGLVGALTDFGAANSMRKTRVPALVGALAAVSALSGRKFVIDGYGKFTSLGIQSMVVAESGVGKETVFDVINQVRSMAGSVFTMAQPASVAGMHNLLADTPTLLWGVDEFGRYLQAASREQGHDFQLLTKMMEMHTGFMRTLGERVYSDSGKNLASVDHPLLVGAYATTPGRFLAAMDRGTVVDGLLGRVLVFQMKYPVEAVKLVDRKRVYLSPRAQKAITTLVTTLPPDSEGVEGLNGRRFWPIRFSEAADSNLQAGFDYFDKQGATEIERTLWRRAFEQMVRLAGVVALGEAAMSGVLFAPTISEDTLNWAFQTVETCMRTMMPDICTNAADTNLERLQNSILLALAENGESLVRQTDVIKRLKGRSRTYSEVKDALESLVAGGQIQQELKGDVIYVRPMT